MALQEFSPWQKKVWRRPHSISASMYAKGRGVPQNYTEAVRWYRLAAEHGFVKAMSNLGSMYSKGNGLPKDYALALRWYQEAADQDLPEAQYNLGVMYKEGKGVPRDLIKAHMWFNLSAAKGMKTPIGRGDTGSQDDEPEEIAQGQRLAREWRDKKEGCSQTTLRVPNVHLLLKMISRVIGFTH